MSECAGKQAFASPQAEQRVQQARKNLHATKVYHCRQCGHYHLGAVLAPRYSEKKTQRRHLREQDHDAGLAGSLD